MIDLQATTEGVDTALESLDRIHLSVAALRLGGHALDFANIKSFLTAVKGRLPSERRHKHKPDQRPADGA